MTTFPSWIAFTRDVSPSIAECELTHLARTPIRVEVARAQHRGYERLLTSLGCAVQRVAPAPEQPDAVFIEDMAVVVDEVAIVTRPGAKSRRREVPPVATALKHLRPIVRIQAPATLDGGDVLVIGRTVFVGRTSRTNDEGVNQMRTALSPFGYAVHGIPVAGCLHLKSAVTALDDRTVLLNPKWVSVDAFADYRVVEVDPAEPAAANILRVGPALVYASSYPHTLDQLRTLGFTPNTTDVSELAKAEGAVTCCSVLVGT